MVKWKHNTSFELCCEKFPDNYIFEGSKESVRKQIGMAVPAKGAKIIFEAILRTFAGIDYESVEPSIKE